MLARKSGANRYPAAIMPNDVAAANQTAEVRINAMAVGKLGACSLAVGAIEWFFLSYPIDRWLCQGRCYTVTTSFQHVCFRPMACLNCDRPASNPGWRCAAGGIECKIPYRNTSRGSDPFVQPHRGIPCRPGSCGYGAGG